MKNRIPGWIWVLFSLLCVSAILILFGSRDSESNPDGDYYGPSGVRAFRELLQSNGIPVSVSRSIVRPAKPEDTIVAFFIADQMPTIIRSEFGKGSRVELALRRHLDAGGNLLMIAVPKNFATATAAAAKVNSSVSSTEDQPRQLSISLTNDSVDWANATGLEYQEKDMVLWLQNESPFAWFDSVGQGVALTVNQGLGSTNRFIDQKDNAEFFLEIAQRARKPGGSFVFYEAAHGAVAEPSLVETIGDWANGAWWQLNLVFVLLIASLGIRFGLTVPGHSVQRGGKDFADAIANLMRRTRSQRVAMELLTAESDREVRRMLKLTMETPKEVRDQAMPESLAQALKMAENAVKEDIPPNVAMSVARHLDTEVARFLHRHDRKPARKKRK